MNVSEWSKRAILRSDMTTRATHLTKGVNDEAAFDILWSILKEKKLCAGSGFVVGTQKVCCFQDVPLISIAENLRYEQDISVDQVRFSPFGIRMNKRVLYLKGGRPVIYGKTGEIKKVLPKKEHWRIVKLDLNDRDNMIDWTHEREWRVQNDLLFEYDEIEIIVKNSEYYRKLVQRCLSENCLEMLEQVNGIIPLNSVNS